MSELGWTWANGLPFSKLKIHVFPRPNARMFILVHDLGRGAEGRVWLAATTSGSACVIKFSLKRNEVALQDECKLWNDVWHQHARVITLAKSPALLMPFVKPLTEEEWQDRDKSQLVRTAVQELVDHGVRHDDLHRRHVGLHKGRVIIFDLSQTSPVEEQKKGEAADYMLVRLGLM